MRLDITAEDISTARARANDCRTHLWHNPLAIALERALNRKCVVTLTCAHIGAAGGEPGAVYRLSAEAIAYLDRWSRDRADPSFVLVF